VRNFKKTVKTVTTVASKGFKPSPEAIKPSPKPSLSNNNLGKNSKKKKEKTNSIQQEGASM